MKKIFAFIALSLCFLFTPNKIFADNNFSTSVNVDYQVSISGNTHVINKVSITNLVDNYYVSSYTITAGFTDISSVYAYNNSGQLPVTLLQTKNGENIAVSLQNQQVGKNKTNTFTLTYNTPNAANKSGNIWEINIPGLADKNDFSDFTSTVDVPSTFGTPIYIKPEQGTNSLTFTKEQLNKSGISIAFGSVQSYEYSINYHLKNTDIVEQTQSIALPMTTNYQTVEIDSLNPKPENVVLDNDGNWLAYYTLKPSQTLNINASGVINNYLYPKTENLSSQMRADYLKEQPYWQISNPQIQKLAQNLKTPQNIYSFVVNTLSYDFSRVGKDQQRLGAVGVLDNPTKAVCLEFTDLFIAIARAAGIPAREVDGYAYTQNSIERPLSNVLDILHAWPEYYDDARQTWVMVDPTWENTSGGVDYFHTLDFDHVAFVIKGENSEYPIPAGGYKIPGQINVKDVNVRFGDVTISKIPQANIGLGMDSSFASGFPVLGTLQIKNTSSILFPEELVNVSDSNLNPKLLSLTVLAIPPYGFENIPFGFNRTQFLTNQQSEVTIAMGYTHLSRKISVQPFTKLQLILGGIICGILIAIILSAAAFKAWRLHISKSQQ